MTGIDDYQGNPLIEALPEILDVKEAAQKIKVLRKFNPEERLLPASKRKHCVERLASFIIPLNKHLEVEQKLSIFIRKGYSLRELFKRCQTGEIPANLHMIYKYKLTEMGYCTAKQRIKQKELNSLFLVSYPPEVIENIGVPLPVGDHNWLARMVRKPRNSYHPLLHALIIKLLWGDVKQLEILVPVAPFGKGPWPCLNKTAIHYREATIKRVTISRCSKTGRPVGSFRCEVCGLHYSRRGPDSSLNSRYRYGRIKEFGHEWKQKGKSLLDKGNSIRSVAWSLGVDSATIKRHILGEKPLINVRGLNNAFKGGADRSAEGDTKRELNDSEEKVHTRKERVDWVKRDRDVAREINQCLLKFRSESSKPVRITVSRLGRAIGKLPLLERHLGKMPLCESILEMNVETEETYQIRKISWAAKMLGEEGERLVKWRILRVAGIRVIKTDLVREQLEQTIIEHTSKVA